MTQESLSADALIALGTAKSCGACILSPQILAYAQGGDPANCHEPQPFSRTERVATRTGSHLNTEVGLRCPTYQTASDGYIEYGL